MKTRRTRPTNYLIFSFAILLLGIGVGVPNSFGRAIIVFMCLIAIAFFNDLLKPQLKQSLVLIKIRDK